MCPSDTRGKEDSFQLHWRADQRRTKFPKFKTLPDQLTPEEAETRRHGGKIIVLDMSV